MTRVSDARIVSEVYHSFQTDPADSQTNTNQQQRMSNLQAPYQTPRVYNQNQQLQPIGGYQTQPNHQQYNRQNIYYQNIYHIQNNQSIPPGYRNQNIPPGNQNIPPGNIHPGNNGQFIVQQPRYLSNQVQVVQFGQFPNQSRYPVFIFCQYCRHQVQTRTESQIGLKAILSCIFILIVCWPLFFIPLIHNDCQDIRHSCPNCFSELGVYRRECDYE